jgi:signal transduction histidine kinase/DNA-binding response OmpR family regulator
MRSLRPVLCLATAAAAAALPSTAPAQDHPALQFLGDGAPAYVHQVWTVADGLPVNSINGVVQGRDGYVWVATFDGLVRFDGVRFTVYGTGTHPGLPSNRIVEMWEASDGSLWLITEQNHLVRFRDERFTHFGPQHGIADNAATVVYEEADGTVWVGTQAGFGWIDGDRFHPEAPAAIDGHVNAILRHPDESLWVGLWDGRVFRTVGGLVEEVTDPANRLGSVHSFSVDGGNAVWVAADRGAFRVVDGRLERVAAGGYAPTLVKATVTGAIPGERWIYSERGVYRLHEAEPPRLFSGEFHDLFRRDLIRRTESGVVWYAFGTELYRAGERLARLGANGLTDAALPEEIRAFTIDHEGSIWIGTNSSGLHRLKPSVFAMVGPPEGLAFRNVYSVFEDRAGVIYVGTWGHGLNRVGRTEIESYGQNEGIGDHITSFAEGDEGDLWVGTYGAGVIRCRTPAMTCSRFEEPSLEGARVFALHRAESGAMWIGSDLGLFRYEGGTVTRLDVGDEVATRPVRVFTEATDGTLWMGSNGDGVFRYRSGRLTQITEDDGLPSNLIRSLFLDADGLLWIGTEGRGLARLDPRGTASDSSSPSTPYRFVAFRSGHGLFDEVIHQIVEDAGGRLWMSTNRGIFWVAREELNSFAEGHTASIHSTSYTERDGLRNREANGGFQPAGIRASDGTLWFATQDGVAIVDPDNLRDDQAPPRVVVERIVSERETRLASTGPIVLEPSERDLQIEYTALSFLAPENVRFRYRLDGYSPDWVEAGNRRTAFYTGLPPGDYVFQVQARASGGGWSDFAALDLTLEPRFTETRLYYSLVALALVLFLLAALRFRDGRIRANEMRLAGLVDERTRQIREHQRQLEVQNAQLAAQATKLEALDEAKSRFFANLSHEFRTPLTLTIGPLEDVRSGIRGDVSDEAEADLDLALRNSRGLLRLVNQMLDVARLEAGQLEPRIREDDLGELLRGVAEGFTPLAERRSIDFDVALPDLDLCYFFDADLMEKVFTNLLSNAFKFTNDGGTVHVSLNEVEGTEGEANGAVMTVRDTGSGIESADLPHIFERFYRAGDGVSPGTGIGLSLAKELVELHGGRIEVTSEPGFGSTFHVFLVGGRDHLNPAWVATDGTEAPARSQEQFEPESERGSTYGEEVPDGESDLDRTTILVVDDNHGVRSYLRRHLSDSFRVLEAADGERGLQLARDELPDVVIADVMMPGMSGLELCAALRSDPTTSFMPFILVTARASPDEKLAGLSAGADDYVTKPFDPMELGARVRNLAQARRRLWQHMRYEARLLADDSPAATPEEQFLDNVRRTIEAHLDDESFDVETLALSLGYSRASLYRRLEGLIEDSPAEIILTVRLERAAKLLRAADRTVSEVAYGVGFKSVSHFSRRFKRRFGVSPSEFRSPYAKSSAGLHVSDS